MTGLTPVTTLTAVKREGASLTVVDGRLSLRAETPIPVELVAAVKEHRDRLLEMLTLDTHFPGEASDAVARGPEPPPVEPCRVCRLMLWWQRPDRTGGGWVCGVCHPDPEMLQADWLAGKGAA